MHRFVPEDHSTVPQPADCCGNQQGTVFNCAVKLRQNFRTDARDKGNIEVVLAPHRMVQPSAN